MDKSPFYQISTRQELANVLNMQLKSLSYVLYKLNPQNLYTSFSIPKKSGGVRDIVAPQKPLANIQSKIANILMLQPENEASGSKASHGFIKNKSILTNAKTHRNEKYVLNTDIQDFFPSFSFGRVLGFFEKNNAFMMDHKIAVALTNLCCYKQKLPQGAPSSPPITNLIFHIVDFKIIKLARKYKLNYTRYVDDLTFSTNSHSFLKTHHNFLAELNALIIHEGFNLNKNKTHLEFNNSRQEVTGIIVNKKLNVHKEFYKKTRAMADNLYKNNKFSIDDANGTIQQLDGRFNYINQLVRYNKKIKKRGTPYKTKYTHFSESFSKLDRFYSFTGKEQQYRKFLFYKYFVYGDSSIILTEGKTDVSYIKLALKKYVANYPQLISLQGLNKFKYAISFLNHPQSNIKNTRCHKEKKKKKMNTNQMSRRIPFFIGISEDGGNAYDHFLKYYSEGVKSVNPKQFPNYPKYFISDLGKAYSKKVIILLDNEKGKGSPLQCFISKCDTFKLKHKEDIIKELNTQGYSHIKYNLFLLTIPFKNDSDEDCTIESLLDTTEISSLSLSGKRFSKDNTLNTTNNFGKQALLKQVLSSNNNFNLSGFIPLLDKIAEINSLKVVENEKYEYKINKDKTRTPLEYQSITKYS